MLAHKAINRIIVFLVGIALLASGAMLYLGDPNGGTPMAYERLLFGEDVLDIQISVDEADWQNLLDNPTAKEFVEADITIDGVLFQSVGIRTKGNSSLTQVASMEDSDRYSLQIKADYYVKGQTFYGLDTLSLNNIISDQTYMKDVLSYQLFDLLDVPTPLNNYANVSVNDTAYGFCLALERYEKSFLERTYGTNGGELYNVKMTMGNPGGQRGEGAENGGEGPTVPPTQGENPMNNMQGFTPPDFEADGANFPENMQGFTPPDFEQSESSEQTEQQGRGGFGGMGSFMMGDRGGGSLIYTDDESTSYEAIFGNSVFKSSDEEDYARVIKAIEQLNKGEDIEQYFDVDEILRYLAAHTFVVNLDSYSSNMGQNYYIYENEGVLRILPWDYNLTLGGFQTGGADTVINFAIDTPVSGVSMEDRPLIHQLLSNETYLEAYHAYLQEIVDYVESGAFEEQVKLIDAKINAYVAQDATAFGTYEGYEASLETLVKLIELRAESVQGQLNGTIPSTSEGQTQDRSALISASGIDLNTLSSGGMGGGGGFKMGNRGDRQQGQNAATQDDGRPKLPNGEAPPAPAGVPAAPNGEDPPTGAPSDGANTVTQDDGRPKLPNGEAPPTPAGVPEAPGGALPPDEAQGAMPTAPTGGGVTDEAPSNDEQAQGAAEDQAAEQGDSAETPAREQTTRPQGMGNFPGGSSTEVIDSFDRADAVIAIVAAVSMAGALIYMATAKKRY